MAIALIENMKKHMIFISRSIHSNIVEDYSVPVEKFNMSYMSAYTHSLLASWRNYDLIVCILGVLGLLLSSIDYEISFSKERTSKNCKEDPDVIFKFLNLVCSFIASIFVVLRFSVQTKFYKNQLKNAYKKHYRDAYQRKSMLYMLLIFELSVLWIFPYPYFQYSITIYQESLEMHTSGTKVTHELCYTSAELLFLLMSLRFYFITKCVLHASLYRDMFSIYYSNKYNTRAGFRFAFKRLLANHHWMIFVVIIASSMVLLAENLRVFERPYADLSNLNYESFINSIWCLFTALSTVGYGSDDIYPATNGGRFICILATCCSAERIKYCN